MAKGPTPKADQLRAMREAKHGGQRRKPLAATKQIEPKPQKKS